MLLEGKVAIVTGSSRGIGASSAKLLAQHGAKVMVNYCNSKDKGQGVVDEIVASGGKAILIRADVTKKEDVLAMVAGAEKEFGPVDILVNNANMSFPIVPFAQYKWEDFERKILNEMKASFTCCQAVLPAMMKRKGGSIINISSGLSRHPGMGFVAHSSAKSALDAFSKALALELGQHGIRVNVIAPGATDTDALSHMTPEMKQGIANATPLKRMGLPGDIAGAVLFFASDMARFVSGTYLPVSGGIQMP